MPTFHYKAQRESGEVYEGSSEAEDRFELYQIVRKEGGTIITYKEEGTGGFDLQNIHIPIISDFFGRIKITEKINFTKNLSAMITAGLSLARALDVMKRQSKNKKFKGVLSSLQSEVEKGETFHDALEKHSDVFSPLMVSMVRAGEESGGLAEALTVVGIQMDRAYQLKKKIRGALIYPTIILIALVGIGVLMMIYIVPTLRDTFTELGVDLPASTKAIIAASNFMEQNTLAALAILISLGVGGYYGLQTVRGKRLLETVILKLPVIKDIAKQTNAARTARTLSSLLSSGVPVVQAINITSEVVQNSHYQEVLKEAEEVIQKGTPLAEVFHKHEWLYPVFVGELVAVGEETGKLPEMLTRIAEFYENEVEQQTKNMSTIIEPFLMIIVGAVVGFFAISMITPIYSVTESI